ncbi:MAG: hypothetical protein JW837_10230 [Sedimentisphaerales bacterium]|nr:hypothetical protein [Sedimentisphaerales bacterium]
MKKFVIGLIIIAVVVVVGTLLFVQKWMESDIERQAELMEFPAPAPGAIVFDMKYRGLSGEKDELRYNSYWGYGGGDNETPFIRDLKKKVKEFHTVYNPHFGKAQYSAVEVKGRKAVALYFDLNADEKFSDNEKILPIPAGKSNDARYPEFLTPDFIVNTGDGLKIPFRTLLQVNFYDDSSRPSCMWSPSCVLEDMSTLNGKPMKLILYMSHDFSLSFNKYGMCSYSLLHEGEDSGRYIPRQTLSSIINYEGQFYNLKLYGSHEKAKSIRAVLEKYTGQTGEIAVEFSGKTKLASRVSYMNIVGTEDKTIQFNVSSAQTKLPTGIYQHKRSRINYGKEKDNEWQLDFITEGPEFTVDIDKTSNVEIGKPVLTISAVDENKRYHSDVKEQTVYSKGTNIFISRIIKGKAGELYGRFYQRDENGDRLEAVEPDITIVDADGKEVVADKIKYG